MITKFITFIHLLIILLNISYVFCTKNKKYDYIFLLYTYFLILHWMFFNNECIISYVYKKMQNNDYESGSHLNNDNLNNDNLKNDDLYNIFGEYKFDILTFFHLLFMINIYMVAKRNNIKQYLIFIFILIFNAYSLNLVITINYKNTNFQFFNDISKISLLLFGLYIYTNKNNIYE